MAGWPWNGPRPWIWLGDLRTGTACPTAEPFRSRQRGSTRAWCRTLWTISASMSWSTPAEASTVIRAARLRVGGPSARQSPPPWPVFLWKRQPQEAAIFGRPLTSGAAARPESLKSFRHEPADSHLLRLRRDGRRAGGHRLPLQGLWPAGMGGGARRDHRRDNKRAGGGWPPLCSNPFVSCPGNGGVCSADRNAAIRVSRVSGVLSGP